MQEGKWLSEEALDVVGKRRKAKGKGEEERYTHLNAEFQRLTRRDKKAFLKEQSVNPVSSVAQSCLTLCDPMNCSRPGLPVHHQLPEFTQTYVH